jgi:hypothetical protein
MSNNWLIQEFSPRLLTIFYNIKDTSSFFTGMMGSSSSFSSFLFVNVFLLLLILFSIIPLARSFSTVAKSSAASSTTTTPSLGVLWEQAGIGNRRKKQNKQQQKQQQNNGGHNTGQESNTNNVNERVIPDPLVPYDSIESVSLVSKSVPYSDDETNADSSQTTCDTLISSTGGNITTSVLAEIRFKDGPNNVLYLDPTQLHQTSDFELWMDLRRQVDVSASQFSVVLGSNYFTSRQQLLEEKVNSDTRQQQKSTEKNNNNSSSFNAAACAWGVKMEPLAFDQYSRVMTGGTGTGTSNSSSPSYSVRETGMHILTHVNPQTGKVYTFGASPDGLVETIVHDNSSSNNDGNADNPVPPSKGGGLLEIKSLWGRRHKSTLPPYDHCPNRYYDQIQGQLAICNREWCDLMLFIPPNTSTTAPTNSKKKRKQTRKRKSNMNNNDGDDGVKDPSLKRNGRNYSIVRVKRNEKYWNETLLPELIKFCDEIDQRKKTAEANVAASGATL